MYILGTESSKYKKWYDQQGVRKNNGSYYYSKEVEQIILPHLSDLPVVIVTAGAVLYNTRDIPRGSVIICHDNRTTKDSYGKFFGKNMLWVCSKQSTVDTLSSYGERAVYVPLSIDTQYVAQFKRQRRKNATAFVGNAWAFKDKYIASLPDDVVILNDMERGQLLKEMAKYKHVIAEGRCLMEAQVLGASCTVPQYPDGVESVYVEAVDSRDVIGMWRAAISPNVKDGMKIVRVTRDFYDLKHSLQRRQGEVYTESEGRVTELLGNKYYIIELI